MQKITAHRVTSSIEVTWRFEGKPSATIYTKLKIIRERLFGSRLFRSHRRRSRRNGRKGRIDPAGMDAGIERVGRLLILLVDVALAHDAAETDLNMLARAAKPIV